MSRKDHEYAFLDKDASSGFGRLGQNPAGAMNMTRRHRKMVVKNYSDIPRFELNGRYYTMTYVYMK